MEELCELCGKRARMLCESDQAKLCWGCDRNVHGANFLVAKHLRVLLCRHCQCPTPWKASGPSLTPTSSLCHRCVPTATQSPNNNRHHVHDDDDDDVGYHSYYDDDEESDDDDDHDHDDASEEDEEEGENQVVPWSSASASAVEGVAGSANSDNDGDMSSNTASGACSLPLNLKRFSHNIHHSDEDEEEIGCSSSEGLANDESSSMSMFRPLKQPRMMNQSQRDASHWHNHGWGEELKIKIS